MNINELLGKVPNLTGPVDHEALKTYLKHYQDINVNCDFDFGVVDIDAANWQGSGSNASPPAGREGCYCPIKDRYYLIPSGTTPMPVAEGREETIETPILATGKMLYYIDCKTGEVVPYPQVVVNKTSEVIDTAAYAGATYSPIEKRIYLIPALFWQYTDAELALVDDLGNPLIPEQLPVCTHWHYIDCVTGVLMAYEHGLNLDEFIITPHGHPSYAGGSYSPIQNKIYFLPFMQTVMSNWHGIDCNDGTVFSYQPNIDFNELAFPLGTPKTSEGQQPFYFGGGYSPTQDRIYLAPFLQAQFMTVMAYSESEFNLLKWHYIDCTTETVGSYDHGLPWLEGGSETVTEGYSGPDWPMYQYVFSTYSPMENKIYFNLLAGTPGIRGIHYVDCNTGLVGMHLIERGDVESETYVPYFVFFMVSAPVYSPLQNRIHFFRNVEIQETIGEGENTEIITVYKKCYIDCTTGETVYYPATLMNTPTTSFYSPLNNRFYFSIYNQDNVLYYLQEYSAATIPPQLAAHSMFK